MDAGDSVFIVESTFIADVVARNNDVDNGRGDALTGTEEMLGDIELDDATEDMKLFINLKNKAHYNQNNIQNKCVEANAIRSKYS